MKTLSSSLMMVLAAVCSSCTYTSYTVEMTPQGKKLLRELTVQTVSTRDPSAMAVGSTMTAKEKSEARMETELERIAACYRKRLPAKDKGVHQFIDTFENQTPNDIGGAGFFRCAETQMGMAYFYAEDFRGSDQPATVLLNAFGAADKVIDDLTAGLKAVLGQEKDFDNLERFLTGQFRRDVKNLIVYLWAASSEYHRPGGLEEEPATRLNTPQLPRVCQYLVRHGYIAPEEAPMWLRAAGDWQGLTPLVKDLCRKVLARKPGIGPGPLRDRIEALLVDPQPLNEAMLKRRAQAKAAAKEAAARTAPPATSRPGTQPAEEADPFEEFRANMGQAILLDLGVIGMPNDKVNAVMAANGPPVMTNGRWDANARRITWSATLENGGNDGRFLPTFCYAVWAEPNVEFQKKLFGKVVLEKEGLVDYCLWRKSLTGAEGKEWDAALAALSGPKDLPKLEAFRFSHEPPATPGESSNRYAGQAIRLITDGLKPKDQTTRPQSRPAIAPAR